MRNPFSSHHVDTDHMQAELREAYAKQGWGTTIVRHVAQPEGDPLAFQFQLPDDERLFEMSELVDAAADAENAPAWVRDQGMSLKAAAEVPGVILVGAICRTNDPSEVFATVTAFASPQVAPLELDKGSVTSDGAQVAFNHEFTDRTYGHMDDIGLVYKPQNAEAYAMSLYHFVIDAAGGKVSLTFASTHDGMGGEYGRTYVKEIAKSLWYGPADQPA